MDVLSILPVETDGPYDCGGGTFRVATIKLWTDEEAATVPAVKAVFDDIRATRKSDFVNNFWRGLANQPRLLERTWSSVKQVMVEPGVLDPLTKELVYIAVSTTNSCSYCVHSHTAAARAKGLSDEQYAEFLAVVGMAAETNSLANSMQIPVDREFLIS
jgi:AhpD family alkylhydroperoxidase